MLGRTYVWQRTARFIWQAGLPIAQRLAPTCWSRQAVQIYSWPRWILAEASSGFSSSVRRMPMTDGTSHKQYKQLATIHHHLTMWLVYHLRQAVECTYRVICSRRILSERVWQRCPALGFLSPSLVPR